MREENRGIRNIGIISVLFATASLMTFVPGSAWGENPVGIHTNIIGVKVVGVNAGWNMLSLPIIPCELGSGQVTDVAAGMITDASASWTPDEFAGHYVRVTSGVQIFSYLVTGNTETDLIVSKGDPQADGIASGDTYAVRPNLEDIFGGVDGPLTAGDGLTTPSDEIVVWDAAAQKVKDSAFLHDIPESEFQGWFDLVWQPSELDIDADMGFWVKHHGGSVGLAVYGKVPITERVITVEGGWNVLGVSLPVPEALNLDGVDQTELELFAHAGDQFTEPADQISVWDSVSQKIVDSAFLSLVPGFEGWLDSVWDPSSIVIVPGQGFWYWAVEDFVWSDIPPYAI